MGSHAPPPYERSRRRGNPLRGVYELPITTQRSCCLGGITYLASRRQCKGVLALKPLCQTQSPHRRTRSARTGDSAQAMSAGSCCKETKSSTIEELRRDSCSELPQGGVTCPSLLRAIPAPRKPSERGLRRTCRRTPLARTWGLRAVLVDHRGVALDRERPIGADTSRTVMSNFDNHIK